MMTASEKCDTRLTHCFECHPFSRTRLILIIIALHLFFIYVYLLRDLLFFAVIGIKVVNENCSRGCEDTGERQTLLYEHYWLVENYFGICWKYYQGKWQKAGYLNCNWEFNFIIEHRTFYRQIKYFLSFIYLFESVARKLYLYYYFYWKIWKLISNILNWNHPYTLFGWYLSLVRVALL